VAGRSGNAGQSDYAMANETLNRIAWKLRADRPDCRVVSVGWGPWAGGMVTPQLKAHFERAGVPLIPLDVGARALVDELTASDAVEVVIGGPPKAEALIGGGAQGDLSFTVVVNARNHGWLADHAIDGVPVVPVVLAMEWFSRAAGQARPDLRMVECADIKVLKGILVSDFHGAGHRLVVSAGQVKNGDGAILSLELRSADGTLHYRARARMAEHQPKPAVGATEVAGLENWTGSIYGGDVLFHGPELQVIQGVDGVSKGGMAGSLAGTASRSWHNGSFLTDVAAMDGGLQMALLWSEHVLGGASLPTAVGALRVWSPPTQASVRAVLHARKIGKSSTVSDLVFTDAAGEVVAELVGVETHLRPKA
jgi:hypothetical protein